VIRLSSAPSLELDPADVSGRLRVCHGRIRENLAGAKLLADATEWDERHFATARAVHDYFARAFPLHVEDEDLRVGPAVIEASGPSIAPLLAELHDEHVQTEELRLLLLGDWARWRTERRPVTRGHQHVLRRFSRSTEFHLQREERVFFPQVDALSESVRLGIVRAMVEARGGRVV
jgi:iron-sulfur cluster repair protein YtfE (RIC family)